MPASPSGQDRTAAPGAPAAAGGASAEWGNALIENGRAPTFAVFARGGSVVRFDSVNNRLGVEFRDAGGVARGATSVAVRTR
jgi:hypothetical protein